MNQKGNAGSNLFLELNMHVCGYAPIHEAHRDSRTSQTLVSNGSWEALASGHWIFVPAEEPLHSETLPAL